MKSAALALSVAAVALTGCMTMSRSAVVEAIPADWAANSRIAEIRLDRSASLKVTPQFDGIFKSRLQAKLDGCAAGQRPLRLEAKLDRFQKANPVMTAMLGGANVLRGQARLVDVATGRQVGVYAIGSTTIGSRIAVIEMGQAEEQMSDQFGKELCEKAFAPPAAN